MEGLRGDIYRSSLIVVTIVMVVLVGVWVCIGYVCSKNNKGKVCLQLVNTIMSIAGILVILETTIHRTTTNQELILTPFHSFYEAIEQPEFYRSMLMNVFLFEPLGLTIPFALPSNIRMKVRFTIGFGFLLSTCVEIIQYVFCLGRTEVDDVICNTMGCVIGAGAYLICRKLSNKTRG